MEFLRWVSARRPANHLELPAALAAKVQTASIFQLHHARACERAQRSILARGNSALAEGGLLDIHQPSPQPARRGSRIKSRSWVRRGACPAPSSSRRPAGTLSSRSAVVALAPGGLSTPSPLAETSWSRTLESGLRSRVLRRQRFFSFRRQGHDAFRTLRCPNLRRGSCTTSICSLRSWISWPACGALTLAPGARCLSRTCVAASHRRRAFLTFRCEMIAPLALP